MSMERTTWQVWLGRDAGLIKALQPHFTGGEAEGPNHIAVFALASIRTQGFSPGGLEACHSRPGWPRYLISHRLNTTLGSAFV